MTKIEIRQRKSWGEVINRSITETLERVENGDCVIVNTAPQLRAHFRNKKVLNFFSSADNIEGDVVDIDSKTSVLGEENDRDHHAPTGSIGIYDAREDWISLPGLLQTFFSRCKNVIILTPGFTYLPYNKNFWDSESLEYGGNYIQILSNKKTYNCSSAIPTYQKIKTLIGNILSGTVSRPKKLIKQDTGYEFEDLSFNQALNLLKSPTSINPQQKGEPLSPTWVAHFRNYIRELITMFYSDIKKELLDQLTSDEYIIHWIPAFTHISWNPNIGQNFELLESLGDSALAAQFKKFLFMTDPLITESILNERKSRYMSREFQFKIAQKMKVEEWLISRSNIISEGLREDLFESFCGALQKVGDLVLGVIGLGDILVMKVIQAVFGKVRFDQKYDHGADTTIVDQIVDKWRLPVSSKASIEKISPNMWRARYYFTGPNLNFFFKSFENLIPDFNANEMPKVLEAVGEARDKNVSKIKAAQAMLSKLESYGITRALITFGGATHSKYYFLDREYKELVDKVLDILKRAGKYDEIVFYTPKNTSTNAPRLIIMVAVKRGEVGLNDEVISWEDFKEVNYAENIDSTLRDHKILMQKFINQMNFKGT